MTSIQLKNIFPFAGSKVDVYAPLLTSAMEKFNINTPLRQASFIAQIGHESGQLRYVEEIASGSAYEGRKDLGNVVKGDGVRFKGRGLIQITGRDNYIACGKALTLDLLLHPELLTEPEYACRSAAWFWQSHGLNEIADTGDQVRITKRINGGTNGLQDRLALFEAAKKVLM